MTANDAVERHGGELALDALRPYGVNEMFTLSGGHIFPFYDAAVKQEVPIYDVRHEQTATFAAEGLAKLTRRPGLAVLTAGPGITNGVSAITTAYFNGSPLVVFGGRAPQARWGSGSLQELDHVPIVASITKLARTATSLEEIPKVVDEAVAAAATPHRGPVFVDFPMDVVFGSAAAGPAGPAAPSAGAAPDPDTLTRAGALIAGATAPALVAGSDVWWGGAWDALRRLAEGLRVPTFTNGLGRGCLAADHELAFSRTRSFLKQADVVVVVGTPLDFRLSFGHFGTAKVVHVVDAPGATSPVAHPEVVVVGDLSAALDGIAEAGRRAGPKPDHEKWIAELDYAERGARAADTALLESAADPIHPARVYGELARLLDRDAVVIGDGGDFVSWAGKLVDSYQPGCWLDPGPYGCLGTGMGYAMAARVAHPDRQVVLMLGDGAAGFSLMDADSLVRHRLPVVIVVGNNGIWGLEKHPMKAIYGYDVAADLQPGCRYDDVVRALGGAGETVASPDGIGPALERGLASGVPYVVNVLLDPEAVYPRSSNLA
jgi:acetolactate synthase-1/2/3 large subunit